jgi:hypothetical protein
MRSNTTTTRGNWTLFISVVRHFHQALNPQHFAKYKHLLLYPIRSKDQI